MKKWEQRRSMLLEELTKQGKLSIGQVQELLHISDSTARRMIIELEQDNCLIRRFGGIQKVEPASPKYSYEETQDLHAEEKKQIGLYAAELVESGDVIFLSGGSTVKYMALALSQRLQRRELTNLSVITNSLVSAEVLSECTDVIMPGGIYRQSLQVLDGSLTEKNLRSMCFTKAFQGVVAVNETEGFMTSDIATNSINEVVLTKASSFYVLADSSKFGKHSFISYAHAKDASGIITDAKLTPLMHKTMAGLGARVLISGAGDPDFLHIPASSHN